MLGPIGGLRKKVRSKKGDDEGMSKSGTLGSLRAPYPVAPRLTGHREDSKHIYTISRDLEKIKNSKPSKKLKRCEHLIYDIVHGLRRNPDDTLLHATAIFALVTIFRIYPDETKQVMLEAGVPGILLDIIKMGGLSGSSRQYASELCFYLRYAISCPMRCIF